MLHWCHFDVTAVAWVNTGWGISLKVWVELVWARDLGLTEAAGQLECPAPHPVCAIKGENKHKQWCWPIPLTLER